MGADLRAALVASCLRGALPPVDLRAVCFVRAMVVGVGCALRRLVGLSERGGAGGMDILDDDQARRLQFHKQ